MGDSYDVVRAAVSASGSDSRVEVNQRALIDKILARYASAGAVYRELLQNSNDAEATEAEIRITTTENVSQSHKAGAGVSMGSSSPKVSQVVYRNNGMKFRTQDWARLKKIAEGNPDVSKVGAFGVGAYTMFSICEAPLVISGNEALAFVWKGDALWTKTAPSPHKPDGWTSFVLPSRDPYPVPDLVEFGQFLCASLTFTQCLKTIRLFINEKERLVISKSQIQEPTIVKPQRASSWFRNDGAVTHSKSGLFHLGQTDGSITETVFQIVVSLDGEVSAVKARYVSGVAKTRIPPDMARRMERVTKKKPPPHVNVQLFINAAAQNEESSSGSSKAIQITNAFQPKMGAGRIFIGFRTSQTTGLAAHLAAPLVPTVEREAIDMQDPTLGLFNTELLEVAGILMRLALEHSMSLVGKRWDETAGARNALETKLKMKAQQKGSAAPKPKKVVSEEKKDDGSSIMSFAKFMARGVTKKISTVLSYADSLIDDGSTELLNPKELRPLSEEERDAILLMQSFCPEQSTPDSRVGTAIAQGFSRCMPNLSPPVLTKTGVVRGNDARMPNEGMEAFVENNVVRKLVLDNSRAYHDYIAMCRPLRMLDVVKDLEGRVLEEEELVRLIRWWTKYSRRDPSVITSFGAPMKQSVRYLPKRDPKKLSQDVEQVVYLKDIDYYVTENAFHASLPMPPTVMPSQLQAKIGYQTLRDASLSRFFAPLPVDVWAIFIAEHRIMTAGQPEDEKMRIHALTTLCQEYTSRVGTNKRNFAGLVEGLLKTKRCIPFDSDMPMQYAAEIPSELYLHSAELDAFDDLGSFHKAAYSLKEAEVSDDFLLVLGVRKSVSVDFLFSQLETLKWSNNPKPLIAYLRSASLTDQDFLKLRSTQYLPAVNDKSRTYAPGELYLPNPDLDIFPFAKILQWPEDLSERSADGKFLQKLGCRVRPPLGDILLFLASDISYDVRLKGLEFVCESLGPHGSYEAQYSSVVPGSNTKSCDIRFLPCVANNPLMSSKAVKGLYAPSQCYSDAACMVMGFVVLDPEVDKKTGNILGSKLRCSSKPGPDALMHRLLSLVTTAKSALNSVSAPEKKTKSSELIVAFTHIFHYLSSRTAEFSPGLLRSLRKESFIPFLGKDGVLEWYMPDDIYFKGESTEDQELTALLFRVIDFDPFLASAGVKGEPSVADLFRLITTDPEKVLKQLKSEAKYRALLRRIAANPPFKRVTPQIKQSRFLLAYKLEDESESSNDSNSQGKAPRERDASYSLAKAEDICIIDNSFFGRMFPVLRAPHESDLEDFYFKIGSSYISKRVQKTFEVIGGHRSDTELTRIFMQRIQERVPLLVAPSVTSRPLVKNASTVLDEKHLEVFEAVNLKAVYKLGSTVRNQRITCCAKSIGNQKNALFVTGDFDWFDVGYAIGGLVLQRCQLEDAFFVGSLLEAPLDQLRSRGFPVDRVLRPVKPVVTEKPAVEKPKAPEVQPNGKVPDSSRKNASSSAPSAMPPSPEGTKKDETSEGMEEILFQMFPGCDKDYVRKRLGPNPSLDKVQSLAEEMTKGEYLREKTQKDEKGILGEQHTSDVSSVASATSTKKSRTKEKSSNQTNKSGRGRLLNRMLNRGAASAAAGMGSQRIKSDAGGRPSFNTQADDGRPVPPENDAVTHEGMEAMLENSVKNSRKVSDKGISSPETLLTQMPEGLQRGNEGCEVIPAQSLKLFGTAKNGIRLFASTRFPESEPFLKENTHALEDFSIVISHLCNVYSLSIGAVAIFYDPGGTTIAFNSNRAVYCNLRFFYALHYLKNKQMGSECYSYWFTTIAHELAHNFATGHNKEHGFYTESYVTKYLPILANLMKEKMIK